MFGLSENMYEDLSKDMSEDISEDMAESLSKDISEDMSKDLSEDISEDMSEDISEHLSEDMPKCCIYIANNTLCLTVIVCADVFCPDRPFCHFQQTERKSESILRMFTFFMC